MRLAALLRSALAGGEEAAPVEEGGERRILPRHDLTGEELGLLVDAVRYKVRIKDLSRTGLSGLTDAPLAPGQKVFLMFEGVDGHAAQICWIRNARMGAHFLEPLTAEELGRLRAHHRLRRRRAGTRLGG
jgi:hypothetical protein